MSKNKRIMIVICIIIAALSFMGGMLYKYKGVINVVEYDFEKSRYTYDFIMPMDLESADTWLDWAISFHQYYIDNYIDRNDTGEEKRLEVHHKSIVMYNKIKVLFLELEKDKQK